MSETITLDIPQDIQDEFQAQDLDSERCVFVNGSQKKEDQCPICFRDTQDTDLMIKEVGCQHTFCAECFLQSTTTKKECPMCRRTIGNKPSPHLLRRVRTHMSCIADRLSYSRRQVHDYWGEPGITMIAYETAVRALEDCVELHNQIAPSFNYGVSLEHMPQAEVYGIEDTLIYTTSAMRVVIDKLDDWLFSRVDRLTAATFGFDIVSRYLEELIESHPRLEILEA